MMELECGECGECGGGWRKQINVVIQESTNKLVTYTHKMDLKIEK